MEEEHIQGEENTVAPGKRSATLQLSVPFHDCDPLFIVWHGRYFEYFEMARCALLAACALDIPQIRELGYRMVVSDARCRYNYPLSYGDQVEVRASFVATRPLLRIAYRVFNQTQSRISARGYTLLATTDAAGKLYRETPDAILERLR